MVWADVVLEPGAVWEAIERTGQTHAPMPPHRARAAARRHRLRILRPGQRAARA